MAKTIHPSKMKYTTEEIRHIVQCDKNGYSDDAMHSSLKSISRQVVGYERTKLSLGYFMRHLRRQIASMPEAERQLWLMTL
jgi:hypothetical protein